MNKKEEKLLFKQNQQEFAKEIIQIVSEYYNVDLSLDSNKWKITMPRTMAVYLCKKHTEKVSLEFLGEILNRKHANLSIGSRRFEERLPYDRKIKNEVNEIEILIQTKSKYKILTMKDSLIREVLVLLNKLDVEQLKDFYVIAEDHYKDINLEAV